MKNNIIYGQILNFNSHKVVGEYAHDIAGHYTAMRLANGKAKRIEGSFSYFADIYLSNLNRYYDITAERGHVEF